MDLEGLFCYNLILWEGAPVFMMPALQEELSPGQRVGQEQQK